MKTAKILSVVAIVFALGSCGDKMTDQQSSMVGGEQTVKAPEGVTAAKNNGTPANTDGTGKPMAGGKSAKGQDSTWNQNAPAGNKPF